MRNRRKKKTENQNVNSYFSNKILEIFKLHPYQFYNYKQISAQLEISGKDDKELIRNTMQEMLQSHLLIEGNRGKYKLNPIHISIDNSNTIDGKIEIKSIGKAYLRSENPEIEDIVITFNNLWKALDGDYVRVHLFPARKGKRQEGRVIEILKRNRNFFVGTIQIAKNISYFVPDDANMPIDILIPTRNLHGAKNGQKVVAAITEWNDNARYPFGKIQKVLGYPGNNDVEMKSILIDQKFTLDFSEAAEKKAKAFSGNISEKEIAKRRDFRNVFTITIDPADAKDFDDAISFKKLNNNLFQIGVHIADVSHYVKEDDVIDQEAYERATSVYLVDRTYPMLPENLCNNICSLKPNEDKLCFSVVFNLDETGKIHKQWIGKTIINSNHRFNYEEVQEIIEQQNGLYCEEILILDKIAKALREERFKHGTINFASEEVKFILDENAKPIGVYVKENKDAHKLIEDFMLLANKKVAEFIGKVAQNETPKTFVYRIHDKPLDEKIGKFNNFVNKLGYSLKLNSRKNFANSVNALFESVHGKGEEYMIETLALRTMQKAVYSTKNIGHYGLAFNYYTHFTSPIRRYPDLMVHRLLERYLSGKASVDSNVFEEKCKHASDMEQRAVEAERNSIKYKQAEFLSDKIGEEFQGIISNISKIGIWVQLSETKCEGMVSVKNMSDDFYYYDEENYKYIGQHNGKEFRLGDKVHIQVKNVNLAKKQMDFVFIDK